MDFGISGKVAIVTGGANGIGAAICARFALEGARVMVVDIDQQKAESFAAELRAKGTLADSSGTDVTDEKSVKAMMEKTASALGRPAILVNNAGFTRDMRITKMGMNEWDSVVDVILKGAFLCTRAAIPHFEEAQFGRIINISSRAHLGNAGQANYSAAKAGLIGFTKAMALENGRNMITVNAVAPGIIDTEAIQRLPHYEKIADAARRTTPIPRIGRPEDVACAVAFLASEAAGYVTGEVLHVTGGRY